MKSVKNMFSCGFTLIELMVTISIMAIIMVYAFPPDFFKKPLGVNYGNLVKQQGRSYFNYVSQNYVQLYNNAKSSSNNIVTIPYSTISSAGFNLAFSTTDPYGNVPCLAVIYNNQGSQLLDLVMYYVAGSNSTTINSTVALDALNYLSGMAGIVNTTSNTVTSAYNIWTMSTTANTFSGASSCGGSLVNNSLVLNINFMNTSFAQSQQVDNSLHRVLDSTNSVGTAANFNTMQTDLGLGYVASNSNLYSGMFLSESFNTQTSPYLTSGANSQLTGAYKTGSESDIVLANVDFVAQSFQGVNTAIIGTGCSNIGQLILNGTANSQEISPILQCTYNPTLCPIVSGNSATQTCYLPMFSTIVSYSQQSYTFTCPSGLYLDLGGSIVYFQPYNSSGALLTPNGLSPPTSCGSISGWNGPNSYVVTAFSSTGIPITISGYTVWICSTNSAPWVGPTQILQANCSISPTLEVYN